MVREGSSVCLNKVSTICLSCLLCFSLLPWSNVLIENVVVHLRITIIESYSSQLCCHFVNGGYHQLLLLLSPLQVPLFLFVALTNTQTDEKQAKKVPRFQIHHTQFGGKGTYVNMRWRPTTTCVMYVGCSRDRKSGPLNPLRFVSISFGNCSYL